MRCSVKFGEATRRSVGRVSVLTDDVTLVDPHEATDAMIDAFTEIRRAAGLSEQLRSLGATFPLAAAS
jgi:diacylglycerol O-acyltransferase / wax synthase